MAPDYTTLTAAVDVASISTAILSVGAAFIATHLAWRAVKFVRSAVKGS